MSTIQPVKNAEVTAINCEIGETEKGTPFVAIDFENDKQETIRAYSYLSEKAFERTYQTLRDTFGFDGNFDTIEGQITDKKAKITVEEEQFNGKKFPRVKWINPISKINPVQQSIRGKLTAMAKAYAGQAGVPAKTKGEVPF
jgi:hypothetical protein